MHTQSDVSGTFSPRWPSFDGQKNSGKTSISSHRADARTLSEKVTADRNIADSQSSINRATCAH